MFRDRRHRDPEDAAPGQVLHAQDGEGPPGRKPRPQGQLGRRLWFEKSTVGRLIAGLERGGWVVRRRDADNRRFVRVELTARGRS